MKKVVLLDKLLKETGLKLKIIRHWINNETINARLMYENNGSYIEIDTEDYNTLKEIKTRKQLSGELHIYDYEIREMWKEIGQELRFIDHMSRRYYTKDEAQKIIDLIEKNRNTKSSNNNQKKNDELSNSEEFKTKFEVCKIYNLSLDDFNSLWEESGEIVRQRDAKNRPLYSLREINDKLNMKKNKCKGIIEKDKTENQNINYREIVNNSEEKYEQEPVCDKKDNQPNNIDSNISHETSIEKESLEDLLISSKEYKKRISRDVDEYNDLLLELINRFDKMHYLLRLKENENEQLKKQIVLLKEKSSQNEILMSRYAELTREVEALKRRF